MEQVSCFFFFFTTKILAIPFIDVYFSYLLPVRTRLILIVFLIYSSLNRNKNPAKIAGEQSRRFDCSLMETFGSVQYQVVVSVYSMIAIRGAVELFKCHINIPVTNARVYDQLSRLSIIAPKCHYIKTRHSRMTKTFASLRTAGVINLHIEVHSIKLICHEKY